jgi:hypothetical protein
MGYIDVSCALISPLERSAYKIFMVRSVFYMLTCLICQMSVLALGNVFVIQLDMESGADLGIRG